jgi:hypothetical protein
MEFGRTITTVGQLPHQHAMCRAHTHLKRTIFAGTCRREWFMSESFNAGNIVLSPIKSDIATPDASDKFFIIDVNAHTNGKDAHPFAHIQRVRFYMPCLLYQTYLDFLLHSFAFDGPTCF